MKKRSTYATKNLEMLKNVKKSTAEINRILNDTKVIQKEINSLNETLNRSFQIVDDTIFADAKKDALSADAYKLVVGINDKYKEITEIVSVTGTATNSAWNLEDKIEKMTERVGALDMGTLKNDLQQTKEENTQLKEKLNEFKSRKSKKVE